MVSRCEYGMPTQRSHGMGRLVCKVSYSCSSLMIIIVSASQCHFYKLWGQRPLSIASLIWKRQFSRCFQLGFVWTFALSSSYHPTVYRRRQTQPSVASARRYWLHAREQELFRGGSISGSGYQAALYSALHCIVQCTDTSVSMPCKSVASRGLDTET